MVIGKFFPFILCGVLFSLTLNILYFLKKHIKNEETKIFSNLLAINLIGLIGELVCSYIGYNFEENCQLAHVATKIYLLDIIVFILYMTFYMFTICYVISEQKDLRKYVLFKKIAWLVAIVSLLILFIMPITTGAGYATGLAVNFTYLLFTIVLLIWGVVMVKNWRHINKRKLVPLIIFTIFLSIIAIIQKINPEITLTTVMEFLVVFILYHTIENPDLKLLNEYIKNKELVEVGAEEKSNILFKISQEVRTPIKKINLLGNLIVNSSEIDKIHDNARDIINKSSNINSIINNVLDITNMDKRNVKITDCTYNVYNLFSQIVYLFKEKSKTIDFKYSINNTIPKELYGDFTRLKQIICSILFNAYKNTEKGYVDLDISNIIKYDICRLIITIGDTGKGMSLEMINNILSENSEIDEKDIEKLNNLDVDLKLVKKLVDIQGGSMMISSDNRGTVFTVVLDQAFDSQKNLEYTEYISKNISNKQRVLIVNDDYSELSLLAKEFKRNSFEVITTMYGKDCVDRIINKEIYDYIIIDDEMEKYNAVYTISELQKVCDISKLNVIVLLGKDKESIKEHYLEDYPFRDYLLKSNYKNEIIRIKEKNK